MKRLALLFAALALLALAPAVLAHGATTGHAGTWTTTDCATWWEENPDSSHDIDCRIWGDGSEMQLQVAPGEAPRVILRDRYATVCANGGSASTQFVALGTGTYDGGLTVTYTAARCGRFSVAGFEDGLHHDPGSDTLWSDPDGDGWGLVWYRVN